MGDMGENGLWFTASQVKVRLAQADNADGLSVLEHRMAKDFSPPLHVHHDESESFHVLAGRFLFRAGDEDREVSEGETLHVPAGVPHSFKVLSDEGRFLSLTRGGFEAAVRSVSVPALADAVPAPHIPDAAAQAHFAETFSAHGIDLIGPPL